MIWARLLAYVTGTVNQELLLRNEYLAAENQILRNQIRGRVLLTEGEKATLAEIAHRLGRKVLRDVAATANPDTILGWYRKLIANKFDGSRWRRRVGRRKVDQETERLVVQMARDNPSWGYDRIVGALANLGHRLSDQTVGNSYPCAPGRFGGDSMRTAHSLLLHDGSPNAEKNAVCSLCSAKNPYTANLWFRLPEERIRRELERKRHFSIWPRALCSSYFWGRVRREACSVGPSEARRESRRPLAFAGDITSAWLFS